MLNPVGMETRVLLIDDNDDQRSLLANVLRGRGWQITSVRGGREALEIAAREQPSIVLTELVLPDVRGLSFARSLRGTISESLHIIALTRIPEDLHVLARKAGYDHVKQKPVDVEALHTLMLGIVATASPVRRTGRG